MVTASDDKTARVSDAATGVPIGKPMQHEDRVWSAAFSPDGARVVTASDDKTARVWNVPSIAPNIVAIACRMLGTNHEMGGFSTLYGIDVTDPICTPDVPAPTPRA